MFRRIALRWMGFDGAIFICLVSESSLPILAYVEGLTGAGDGLGSAALADRGCGAGLGEVAGGEKTFPCGVDCGVNIFP